MAWAFAREIQAAAALDFSFHQGGLAWASGVNADVSWPRILAARMTSDQLFEVARPNEGIRLCSGGSPPDISIVASAFQFDGQSQHVVVDGGVTIETAVQLLVIPNQLAAIQRHQNFAGPVLCVVRPSDIPTSIVRSALADSQVTFLKQESTISKSLRLGYGIPRTRALSRAVNSCLRDLNLQ